MGGRREGRRRRGRELGGLEELTEQFLSMFLACMGLREFYLWVSWIFVGQKLSKLMKSMVVQSGIELPLV